MQEETPEPRTGADERPPQQPEAAGAESRKTSEEQQKVTPRMSVEEHLAGLWKVLGLGD